MTLATGAARSVRSPSLPWQYRMAAEDCGAGHHQAWTGVPSARTATSRVPGGGCGTLPRGSLPRSLAPGRLKNPCLEAIFACRSEAGALNFYEIPHLAFSVLHVAVQLLAALSPAQAIAQSPFIPESRSAPCNRPGNFGGVPIVSRPLHGPAFH